MILRYFEKVSESQWEYSLEDVDTKKVSAWTTYENLYLPARKTRTCAGYDFSSPFDFVLKPNEQIIIPTGIKVHLRADEFLMIVPRSSLGFKYNIHLANTIGIIDSDYCDNPGNEGHIFVKLVNGGNNILTVKIGDGIAQGIMQKYYIGEADGLHHEGAIPEREGGLGSTDRQKGKFARSQPELHPQDKIGQDFEKSRKK